MLACRIHAKEDLRIEPVDTPSPGPGEVLTDVQYANVGVYDGRTGEIAAVVGSGGLRITGEGWRPVVRRPRGRANWSALS